MTEQTRNEDDTEATEESGPRGGERLRAARKEKKISSLDIAKELHLDQHKISALEANDFAALGAPVFARGYLRKYAELVGVDPGEVLSDYGELTHSDGVPLLVGKRRQPGKELSPGPWVILLLAVLALVFAFWWFSYGRTGADSATVPSAPAPVPAAKRQAASAAVAAAGFAPDIRPDALPAELAPAIDLAEFAERPVDPESIRVTLRFGEDCWTEITDASGQRLYFELGRAGTSVDVAGVPPLSLLLGNADKASLWVNGEVYALDAADRRGRTVRLSLP